MKKKKNPRIFHPEIKKTRDFRPHFLVLALFLAAFGIYQFFNISSGTKGLEASAIGSALGAEASSSVAAKNDVPNGAVVPVQTATTTTAGSHVPQVTFSNIQLLAKSAVVIDTDTGQVLFEKNAKSQLPLASITKVMSALVAKNLFHATDTISITPNALATEGEYGFDLGGKWTFQNLLNYTLVISANDGIQAIADAADLQYGEKGFFVKKMNEEAKTLGFSSMYFVNPSGLDENANLSGGYGSALDTAALMQYVYKKDPTLLSATTKKSIEVPNENGVYFEGENTDEIISSIPNLLASKTGYTDLAGGNLAITWNAGLDHPMTAVVLGSTFDGRFSDMKQIIKATQNSLGRH